MINKLFLLPIFSLALSMQDADAFFDQQTIEAEATETNIRAARQAAKDIREDLIANAEQDCLKIGNTFEVLREWTTHRKSGFKWVATAGAVVSCQ